MMTFLNDNYLAFMVVLGIANFLYNVIKDIYDSKRK